MGNSIEQRKTRNSTDTIYRGTYKILKKKPNINRYVEIYEIESIKQKTIKQIRFIQLNNQMNKLVAESYNKLKSIHHPNIISVQQLNTDQTTDIDKSQLIYQTIIVEQFHGSYLSQTYNRYSQKIILQIYSQLKDTLKYLHKMHIIHANLNLNNIRIDHSNFLMIDQLGIQSNSRKIRSSLKASKLFYMPPEYLSETKNYLEIDLWSVGIILLELTTKKRIFEILKIDQLLYFGFQKFINSLMVSDQLKQILLSLLTSKQKRKFIQYSCQFDQIEQNLSLKPLKYQQFIKHLNLSRTKSVTFLNSSNSMLTNQYAKLIAQQCKRISKIDLSGNQVDDQLMIIFRDFLYRLKYINLSFTNLTDKGLQILALYAENCEILDLSYTKITNKGLKLFLPKFKKLKIIRIWSGINGYPVRYYDHIIQNFRQNYQKFQNNKIQIDEELLKILQGLKLEGLTINAKKLKLSDVILKMSKNVRSIQIQGHLNKQALTQILQNEQLIDLYLSNKNLKNVMLRSKKLQHLSLIKCQLNFNIVEKSSQLISLKLQQNGFSNDEIIKFLNFNTNKLQRLSLANNQITSNNINSILAKIKNIQSLDLSNNNIKSEGCSEICRMLKNLTTLNLQNNGITKKGISMLSNLQKIKSLNLNYNNIGRQGIIEINNLTELINLEIASNQINNFTENQIKSAFSQLKNLRYLSIVSCGFNIVRQNILVMTNIYSNQVNSNIQSNF